MQGCKNCIKIVGIKEESLDESKAAWNMEPARRFVGKGDRKRD